jgi:hypothetical protein
MDKVGEALQELIRQGGPVAQQAIYYWFGVRAIDAISGVLIAAVIIGGACFITTKIVNAVREYNKTL